ncbi:hypothetical protein ACLOJK_007117, partial [Asimina triloba]
MHGLGQQKEASRRQKVDLGGNARAWAMGVVVWGWMGMGIGTEDFGGPLPFPWCVQVKHNAVN